MLQIHRLSVAAIAAALGLLSPVCAQGPVPGGTATPPAAATSGPLTAEQEAELMALLAAKWDRALALRGSLGWRDNVLLSPFAPLGRAFGRGEWELMFWRPARDKWELVTFLGGDVMRYFSPPPETGGEQQWFVHGEVRWEPVPTVRIALKGDAFFQDTVIDLSETEAMRVVAPTRAQGAFATLAPRLMLPGGFALEPVARIKRTDLREFPGDYVEGNGGARLEWRRGDTLRLSAAWFGQVRRYAQRTQFTAGGRALPGTLLRFRQREGELKIATTLNATGKWTGAATVGRLENRDGTSGYFDYNQNRGRLELGWEGAKWKVALDAEARRMTYRVQTVGIGIAPPARRADLFETTGRIERRLGDAWLVFASQRWERSRSNEVEFSYRDNTVLAGLQRSF